MPPIGCGGARLLSVVEFGIMVHGEYDKRDDLLAHQEPNLTESQRRHGHFG